MPIAGSSKRLNELVIKEYADNLSRDLRGELDRELSRLAQGSCVFSVRDLAKFKREKTFSIPLEGLPEALEQDLLVVYSVESSSDVDDDESKKQQQRQKSVVTKGFISSIDNGKIKIILDSKPNIIEVEKKKDKDKEKSDETDNEPSEDNEKLVKFEVRFDRAQFDEKASKLKWAVSSLEWAQMSPHLLNSLLNCYEERANTKYLKTRVFELEDSPGLSKKQKLAVEQALMKRISLIEGVAGSGKTLVAATIANSMSRTQRKERRKVLLCSPIQATVNKLARILSAEHGIGVVQLTPDLISERLDKSYNRGLCLKESAREEAEERWFRRVRKHLSQPTKGKPHMSDYCIERAERDRLKEADVVCCTLEQSLNERLRDIDFKTLIIDDAQYAREYECLLPMRFKGIKQVTLIGDMRRSEQLGSNSMRSGRNRSLDRRSKNRYQRRSSFIADSRLRRGLAAALPNGLEKLSSKLGNSTTRAAEVEVGALFDRWLARGLPSVVLKFRYRRINKLDAFLRNFFYPFDATSLAINRKISSAEQPSNGRPQWPPKTPILFDVNQVSFEDILEKLSLDIRKWDRSATISMITNYEPDTRRTRLLPPGLRSITDIGCANDYLGQQSDYVILVCQKKTTEPKRKSRITSDYLQHDDALMIALTRACRGLFIVANLTESIVDDDDKSQPAWNSLVQYCREENLVLQEYPKTD